MTPREWTRLAGAVKQFGASLLDLVFPRRCAGCQKEWLHSGQGFWCVSCRETLLWARSPLCPVCGRPFVKSPSSPDHLCGECVSETFPFDSARSAVLYFGAVQDRIRQLKFGAQLHWVPPLVELLAEVFPPSPGAQADLLIPVPLHKARLRERGFNQAGLLAKAFGRKVNLPVHFAVLERAQRTRPQTRLSRRERLENVKGAFRVVAPRAVEGKSLLLLDDVFTTGSTLSECTKALRAAGACEVHVLTVARALPEVKDYANPATRNPLRIE